MTKDNFEPKANKEKESITFVNDAEVKRSLSKLKQNKIDARIVFGKTLKFVNTAEFKKAKSLLGIKENTMKKSELINIIREEIQNHLVEASENDLLKILRKGITNGLDKIYGSNELKNATKGPSNMIPKALYHSGSLGITFRSVYSKSNVKLYLLHINYPTNIYDKDKHKRLVNWVETILKKNKFAFKNETNAVGGSNAVLEYYIQHPDILKENINLLEVERINVKNVGEAKRLLKSNGIKVTSSGHTNGNEGWVSTNDSGATSLLRSYGVWRA